MTSDEARAFVAQWLAAWNSRDLERILSHWVEDCVFTSPYVVSILGQPSGRVRGKDALRMYWGAALERYPDLKFDLLGVFLGVDSVVIEYRNQRGQMCGEWIRIGADGRATEGIAHYDRERGRSVTGSGDPSAPSAGHVPPDA